MGFVSGFFVGNIQTNTNITPVKSIGEEATKKSDADKADILISTSDAQDTEDKTDDMQNSEEEMLKELEQTIADTFKEKYPDLTVSFSIKNFDTGVKRVYNACQMDSEGVMELFIAEAVLSEVANGNYELTDEKTQALSKMILESDSDAINMFIDELGGVDNDGKVSAENKITLSIEANDYIHTQLNRKMYSANSFDIPPALNNYTGVKDTISVLERIYQGYKAENENAKLIIDLLKETDTKETYKKITDSHSDITINGNFGEAYGVQNNYSIIMSEDFNLGVVFLTFGISEKDDGTFDAEYHENIKNTMADITLELIEKYKEKK